MEQISRVLNICGSHLELRIQDLYTCVSAGLFSRRDGSLVLQVKGLTIVSACDDLAAKYKEFLSRERTRKATDTDELSEKGK